MSKSIRNSFDHKTIPEDLRAAMEGRAKLYSSAVGEASDVMNLAAGVPVVGGLALESPDLDLVRLWGPKLYVPGFPKGRH